MGKRGEGRKEGGEEGRVPEGHLRREECHWAAIEKPENSSSSGRSSSSSRSRGRERME